MTKVYYWVSQKSEQPERRTPEIAELYIHDGNMCVMLCGSEQVWRVNEFIILSQVHNYTGGL